ncbi:MAG TPA: DUF6703 family protein [Dermatophilaceae bacterium]|nr:DUF6703 family protein [Dermatophilaceae bacterium]
MSSLRTAVETASLPALTRLSRLPRAVPFLVVLALMVAGILVPGWGWLLHVLVAVLLLWLLYLGWPQLRTAERTMRVAVVAVVLAVAVTQAFPR